MRLPVDVDLLWACGVYAEDENRLTGAASTSKADLSCQQLSLHLR